MKFYKKLTAVFLIFTAVLSFTACSISSPSQTSALPDDGIVKESIFEDAMKNSKMLTFDGQNNGVSYSWFFDGGSISSVSDQNLKVIFLDAGKDLDGVVSSSEMLKIHFNETNLISAKTTLEIKLSKLWKAEKVEIYQKVSGSISWLLEAPLNNDTYSSLSFPITDTNGDFYIVAKNPSFKEVPSNIVLKSTDNAVDQSQNKSSKAAGGKADNSKDNIPVGGGKSIADSFSSSSQSISSEGEQQVNSSPGKAVEQWSGNTTQKNSASSQSTSADGKDQYLTDPIPKGKPNPTEPQNAKVDKNKVYYCTLSIDCKTILDNRKNLKKEKESVMPGDGIILKSQKVMFYDGESVFDVLLRETKKSNIQMEYEATPMYNSNYIEGIHNLYEFDCGELSGWMYKVNGWYPNYGCSRYMLKNGDVVNWRYTCDLGRDVGCDWDVSKK